MASKKVTAVIKLQCPAGSATPAPPIGPALGPHGVSAPKFVQEFNDRTKSMEKGLIIPVVLTVYADKSYTFELKTPPAAVLIKKALKLEKGSGNPLLNKVGTLSKKDLDEIANTKFKDLNANDIEAAKKIIAGTARSMGVEVEQ
ncbi:MAG: 50S ribosomal protein L11 [Treponemataceae bacterium]|nr:50S ribosomal protein L11 [Treponema sp.]MDE6245683.1 50S ribosomal protein L11 [Treponemataceae bacterium]MDE7383307.1 50S ribosomal protein L11 [Treponemataceae bacterium]